MLGPEAIVASNLELVDRQAVDEAYRDLRRRAGSANRAAVDWMFSVRKAVAQRQNDTAYRGRFRLVGYCTEQLAGDRVWSGPAGGPLRVAVVGVEPADAHAADPPRPLLAPLEAFRFGLDQQQFIDLLAQRGIGPGEFVERVRHARREHGGDGDLIVARDLMNMPATPLPGLLSEASGSTPATAPAATPTP